MFPASSATERQAKIENNLRAIDEAAELRADSLVLVVGASPQVSLADARQMVADGLAAIVPYAREREVKLGLEPLHPMYAADRSVLNTIEQALKLAASFPAEDVGLILDVFHIWWDPMVMEAYTCRQRPYLRLPCLRLARAPARHTDGPRRDG